MMYCGNKAKAFVNEKWTAFMSIEDAKQLERQARVDAMTQALRAGKSVIAMRGEEALLDEARKASK